MGSIGLHATRMQLSGEQFLNYETINWTLGLQAIFFWSASVGLPTEKAKKAQIITINP